MNTHAAVPLANMLDSGPFTDYKEANPGNCGSKSVILLQETPVSYLYDNPSVVLVLVGTS
jgi:hypothetical protein